jgi:hypothetical protein
MFHFQMAVESGNIFGFLPFFQEKVHYVICGGQRQWVNSGRFARYMPINLADIGGDNCLTTLAKR